jgi:hypothetical protein
MDFPGPGRQDGTDFHREVNEFLVTGPFVQALGDERGGLGDVTAGSRRSSRAGR